MASQRVRHDNHQGYQGEFARARVWHTQLKTPLKTSGLLEESVQPPPRAQGPQAAGPGCRQQRALGEPRSARTWRGATRPLAARRQDSIREGEGLGED